MTDTLIARIGRALWGDFHWKTELAYALNINKSSARRLGDGRYIMPVEMLKELRPLLLERRSEIDALLKKLPQ